MAAAKRSAPRGKEPVRSAYEADWRRRFPERAAEERAFRKARADRERRYAGRDKLHDGGTAETRAKARIHAGALARLYEAGHLTIDQLAGSQQIKQVIERIGSDVRIGSFSLETRVDRSRGGDAFFEALGAVRAEVAYGRWRARPGAAVVIAMIAEDLSLTRAARLLRMSKVRARGVVGALLDDWSEDMRAVFREIDEGDLLAAQAGLF